MRNPRIFVTLDPELADAIRRIGLGTDKSQSAVIGALLDAQRPVLLQLADTLDKARSLSVPLSGALTVSLGKGEDATRRLAEEAQEQLHQLSLNLDEELEKQGIEPPRARSANSDEGARGGAPKGSQPPYINKGARIGGSKPGQAKRKAGK